MSSAWAWTRISACVVVGRAKMALASAYVSWPGFGRGDRMGRSGQPGEVARAILWLASAEASFASGTFIDVTGGK